MRLTYTVVTLSTLFRTHRMKFTLLLITGTLLAASSYAKNTKMEEVFHWKQIDYAFPDENTRKAAIEAGEFVQENNLPLGLEVWNDKLFITVPRWKSGIPSSLNYVKLGKYSLCITVNNDHSNNI